MLKGFALSLIFGAFLAAILFGSAGDIGWPAGWAFLILFSACSQAIAIWLARTDPDLLAERMRAPNAAEGQKPRDRAIIAALQVAMLGWIVLMALDARRFRWSHVPVWGQVLGAVLIVAGFYAWSRVLAANRFATTRVRVQEERGQTVISTGPYAIVRHPMYADALMPMVGIPLLLGSLWGLLGLAVFIPILAARALGEEQVLMDGLPGYPDYAAKVRFRLVPGVW
jgi:protein-S-isoprenylcysteine O-methyltransferase Ste14